MQNTYETKSDWAMTNMHPCVWGKAVLAVWHLLLFAGQGGGDIGQMFRMRLQHIPHISIPGSKEQHDRKAAYLDDKLGRKKVFSSKKYCVKMKTGSKLLYAHCAFLQIVLWFLKYSSIFHNQQLRFISDSSVSALTPLGMRGIIGSLQNKDQGILDLGHF